MAELLAKPGAEVEETPVYETYVEPEAPQLAYNISLLLNYPEMDEIDELVVLPALKEVSSLRLTQAEIYLVLVYESRTDCVDLEIDGNMQTVIPASDCVVVGDRLVYEAKDRILPGLLYRLDEFEFRLDRGAWESFSFSVEPDYILGQ